MNIVGARNHARLAAGAVIRRQDDSVCITPVQRNVHVTFEALALIIAAPFSFWIAFSPSILVPLWARILSGTIGAATLAVDGGLLFSYMKEEKE